MYRFFVVAIIATVVVGNLVPNNAFALASDEEGNEPLIELNYTAWKGIMPIVNDKARVYYVWVNGNESFYYKGATKQLNVALAAFAKMEVKNHVIVLRPGAAERRSISTKTRIPYNWELHVIGGDVFKRTDPVLTVYIDDDIDLDKLEIPEDVTLRTAPDANDNEAASKKIEQFLKKRQNLRSNDATRCYDHAAEIAGYFERN